MRFTKNFTRKSLKAIAGGAVLAVAIPTIALAASPFDDIDPAAFYADAVEWAYDNNITTGTSPTTFSPDDNVTRGQNVTFAKRYHDNIVAPALADVDAELDALSGDVDGLDIPTVHSAWVAPSGGASSVGTTDGVTSETTGTGRYVVTFPTEVTNCSWSIVHRTPGGIFLFIPVADYTDEPHFELSTEYLGVFPNQTAVNEGIVVLVTDSAEDQKNTNFQIQAIC